MISIIIPAYNEEKTIAETIETLRSYFDEQGDPYELIVVSDGSVDRTYSVAKELEDNRVRVFSYENNQGKGHALKYGFGKSRGDQIVFFDAGMNFPPEQILEFLERLNRREGDKSGLKSANPGLEEFAPDMVTDRVDLVIGSKRHPESTVNYPWHRKLVSWGAQATVRILFNLNVTDTQVGLKAFRREVLEKIMPLVLVKRYAFDIELLALAHHYGYSIMEAPVKLDLKMSTAVSPRSLKNCFLDTLAVFYRLKILGYYDLSEEDRQEMLDNYPVTTVDKIATFILGNFLQGEKMRE